MPHPFSFRPGSVREPSLRVWLTAPFLVLMLASAGLVGWLGLTGGREAVLDVAGQLRAEVLFRVRQTLAAYLSVPPEVNALNAQALGRGLLVPEDPRNAARFFATVVEANPSIAYSFYGDAAGEFYGARRLAAGEVQIVRAGRETGGDSFNFAVTPDGDVGDLRQVYRNFDPRTRPWYKAGASAHGPAWTPVYRHFALGVPTVTACLPAYAPDGALRGVFGVDYPLTRIHDFLRTIKVGRSGEVYLLERSGALLAASSAGLETSMVAGPDGTFALAPAGASGLPMLEAAVAHLAGRPGGLAGIRGEVLAQVQGEGGDLYLLAEPFSDGRGLDWLMVAVAPASDFMGRIDAGARQTVAVGLLGLAAAAAAGIVVSRRISRPVERLAEAADAISLGRWDLPVPAPHSRELRRLAEAFARMTGQLRQALAGLTEQHAVIAGQNRTLEARVAARTAELTHMHRRLRAIFDAIPGYVHVVDRDLKVVDAGDKLLRAMNLSREAVLGRPCHEVFRGLDAACDCCHLAGDAAEAGGCARPSTPEEEALLGMPFLAYSAPIVGEDGRVWGHIECLMDVSRLREAERKLAAAKEEAEEANRAKSDFLAKMSHDIRTPLNSIIGLTDITLQSRVPADVRDNLAHVLEAARSLLELVGDLLDFSRAEAKGLTLKEEDFSLARLLAVVVRSFTAQARFKGVKLRLRQDRACPRVVRGDPARLRQILANLVGNALKFTEHGQVALRVEPAARPAALGPAGPGADGAAVWLRFTVADTGLGIAAEALATIFEPFRQASGDIAARFGGSGLGLAICRQMVDLMGGVIEVASTPGEGSVFAFTVPLAPGDPAKAAALAPPARSLDVLRQDQRPMHLLLAEDNPMNVKLAKALLARLGHRLTVAGSGREAIARLAAESFDAVLMDVEMPEMDGIEATRRIRAGEAGAGRSGTPIVAMTAHALSTFMERCRQAGVDAFVAKPVDFGQLADVLRAIACRDGSAAPPQPDPVRRAEAIARLDGDTGLYGELCRIFCDETPLYRERLAAALAARDMAALGQAAHSIKNSCGAVGAGGCRALADELAALAAAGDLAGLRPVVETLDRELARVAASLAGGPAHA
ncbi:multi-sensor hybrid histidine kinase [Solidesulfovibrio carbinoliphilus subsp. oakridgensis]|uniref:histidine kinase n=1 Tax=Solidesulfovibrio carbinoliphilus subsp. oakridgensis TaxID=694327 RepID=G7Q8M0_9BACT|nr:ATP-binding protein [Solidesulfovibrio carbinoliphilus]EHJ49107.1 multi-sensor hybrid histidine kinase [Solidesulfovibrio carbinoliphilus subsp. oakridgensis]